MSSQDEMVTEFRGITDTSEERAKFFLESSGWQLQVALSSFFDSGIAENPTAMSEDEVDDEYVPEEDPEPPKNKPGVSTRSSKVEPKRTTRSSKFASVHDYKNNKNDDSSEEEGQRYYAGGSEHSGELIVGPPRKKNTQQIKDLFKEAKEHGAEVVDEPNKNGKEKEKKKYFTGAGYKLGDGEESPSVFVPGEVEQQRPGPVNVVLKLWSNGFTVDDGPLRDFNDPENQEFLQSVKKGQIPRELIRNAKGGEVHVDMEDHREEEYKPQKKKLKPFSGQGQMLGSPTPQVETSPAPSISSSVDPPISIDQSKPSTNIQIRLLDGTRIRQQFNHDHRISDIRSFISNSQPNMGSRPFVLMTTFPNKELTNENETIADAQLLNSQVVQKLK
ncbi:NSFL1 cofactor p47-like isoform X1 [Ciona intestinalis]